MTRKSITPVKPVIRPKRSRYSAFTAVTGFFRRTTAETKSAAFGNDKALLRESLLVISAFVKVPFRRFISCRTIV